MMSGFEVCSSVAAVLFKVEVGVHLGLTKASCTGGGVEAERSTRQETAPLCLLSPRCTNG